MLILGRGVQGFGTGGLISVPMTILGDIVAPKYRARYYTYFSMTYITSGFVGPAFGGFISQQFHWSMIFWTNVPMGLAAFIFVNHLLKRLPRYERPHRLDLLGATLIVVASATSMFVLNAGGRNYAWNGPEIIALSAVAIVTWIGFVWRLLRAKEPLIPLTILRNPVVFFANMSNAMGWATLMALNIYLPMYLQAVHGLSPVTAALYMVGLMSAVNGSALVSAQVTGRIKHYKYPPLLALLLSISASAYLAYDVQAISLTGFEIAIILIGMGFGPVAPVSTVALQNAVPLHQMGISISTMAFIRSLMATAMVAAYGVILLGNVAVDFFGDRAQAAANFKVIFYVTAGGFLATFIALALMKEVPLEQNHKGS
jgi:MFS family permease